MYQEKENIMPALKAFVKTLASCNPIFDFAIKYCEEKNSQIVQRKLGRLEEFFHSLSERVENMDIKFNEAYLNKDDFGDIFEQTANYIMNERVDDKRRCFKNIFINSITASSCSYEKTEKYMRLLDDMNWLELKVLGVLYNPSKFNADRGYIIKDIKNVFNFGMGLSGQSSGDVLSKLLEEDKEEIKDALYYLEMNRLIIEQTIAIRTQTNDNPIHILDDMLTTKGKDFVRFILLE